MMLDHLHAWLTELSGPSASDLYLTVGAPPILRGDDFRPLIDEPLQLGHVEGILDALLNDTQRATFEADWEFNMAYMIDGVGRFRVNIFRQRGLPGLVIRKITTEIPTLEQLKLPDALYALAEEKRGLVIMVGGTGSGKSTTLAAMIGQRNGSAPGHIITIEDPVEFVHEHRQCIVTQREVGVDTPSYESALKNALRQKPDLILLGEIRDALTMEYAINIAETGHLCLATLHANNANQALERIISFFPRDQHMQVLLNLSLNLKALLSQRLVRRKEGGRRAVLEILLNEGLVKDLIRKGDVKDIKKVMAENTALGMMTFDQSLLQLWREGEIDEKTAISEADNPTDLKIALRETKMGGDAGLASVDTSKLSL